MIIEDGTGHGHRLKIDDHNRVYTISDTRAMISHVSLSHEEAYMAAMPITTISGYGGRMLSFKNTRSGNVFVLSRILAFWNGGSITGGGFVEGSFFINDSAPTAGYVQSQAGNLNMGSGNVADADVYYWDGVTGTGMTQTGGIPGVQVMLSKGFADITMSDAMILPYNYTFTLYVYPTELGRFTCILTGFYQGTSTAALG